MDGIAAQAGMVRQAGTFVDPVFRAQIPLYSGVETVTGIDIGPETPDRNVIVVLCRRVRSSQNILASATIGNQSATFDLNDVYFDINGSTVFRAKNVTGTTVDISWVIGGVGSNDWWSCINVYTIEGNIGLRDIFLEKGDVTPDLLRVATSDGGGVIATIHQRDSLHWWSIRWTGGVTQDALVNDQPTDVFCLAGSAGNLSANPDYQIPFEGILNGWMETAVSYELLN